MLDILIEHFYEEGFIIDWISFYEDSLKSLWKPETTLKRIEYALQDVFGKEYSESVIYNIKRYIDFKYHREKK